MPFAWVGQAVELRGCAGTVQILGDVRVIAEHPRHTQRRLVVDPDHYEGHNTDRLPHRCRWGASASGCRTWPHPGRRPAPGPVCRPGGGGPMSAKTEAGH